MKAASGVDLLQHALELHERGDFGEAAKFYRDYLIKSPDHVNVRFLLGTVCLQMGEFEEGKSLLEQVLAKNPEHIEALKNLAIGMNRQGRHAEGLLLLERALKIDQLHGDIWHTYGEVLESDGRLNDAENAYRRWVGQQPECVDAYIHLGLVLKKLEQREEAEMWLRHALQMGPTDRAKLLNDIAVICHEGGRLDEAVRLLQEAIALVPDYAIAHDTYAACLKEMGAAYLQEALNEYRKAAVLEPADQLTLWNIALAELELGQLESGWDGYEWRWSHFKNVRHPDFSQWEGGSLAGRAILVYPEQGVGDELLFASCLPDVIEQAQHVGVICDRRLVSLYRRSFPHATIYGGREPGSETWSAQVADNVYDVCSAVGSLPRWLRRAIKDFPLRNGYLVADSARVEFWRHWLTQQAGGNKWVGLCWRSGLRSGIRHRFYPTIEDCEPLFAVPGITWVNLQYDECQAELQLARERFDANILECPGLNLRDDLDDQAALIAALDAVVSAPTAVAELAAALGKPVLRQSIGWTSLGTDQMPWHPTMQVFARRSSVEPWQRVMEAMAREVSRIRDNPSVHVPVFPMTLSSTRCVEAALKLMAANHREESLRLCAVALAQDDKNSDAWYLQGVLQYQSGKSTVAVGSLNHAIAGNPLETSIYLARARASEASGKMLAAKFDYQLVLAMEGFCTEASEACRRLAEVETLDADIGATLLGACQSALAHQPRNAVQLERGARALTGYGYLTIAEEMFLAALQIQPDLASVASGLKMLPREHDLQAEAPVWKLVSTRAGVLLLADGQEAMDEGGSPLGFVHVEGLLHGGNTALIVGCGDGLAALACARAVGDAGLVLVLEGSAEAGARLHASFVLNSYRHALVECVDAAGGALVGMSPLAARYLSAGAQPLCVRLERCDLIWIEHVRPVHVLARLQEVIGRCKPFIYIVGLQVDPALEEWLSLNTYAHLVCPVTIGGGKLRTDLLLHPAV